MEERSKTGFIRDLIIKIFLILLFVFLITLLFPMPNLTPFYNRIFNDNVQTMKEAAEDYFTKDRMPEKEGSSSKLTLQQMIDKKLVLPFVDKDGNECDTNKSYVKVTKKKKEYELEVHLTCGDETNYIVEPIGCYNFCPEGNCSQPVVTNEETGKVTINVPSTQSDDKYKLQYLYTRSITNDRWVTGDWTTSRKNEGNNVKLIDTKTEYTGQKKVASGTRTYDHIKYGYKDNWTYDNEWTDTVKQITDTVKLADTRTLYTGKKKIAETKTEYIHEKWGYKDNWTYDNEWTDEVKTETDKLKLYATRTLYTGQRRYSVDTTRYTHVKYGTRETWKETGYQENKYKTNDNVVYLGTRYTVRKTTKTTTGGWSSWVKDTTWRTSKPADTSTKQWSDAYNKRTTITKSNRKTVESAIRLTSNGNTVYEFLYSAEVPCKTTCANGQTKQTVYYYDTYQNVETVEYQYMYRTYSSSATTNVDEKVVTDPTPYTNNGYTIVKYEYNYKVRSTEKYVVDTKVTDSKTSPEGYEYANQSTTIRTYKYESLNKWVTSKEKLGEYTYYVKTRTQYKYKHNNPEKYKIGEIRTNSKTSPEGYTYLRSETSIVYRYVDFGKWVTNPGELGEYTFNLTTRKQYKYKYNNPERVIIARITTDSIVSPAGFEYAGTYKDNRTETYVDLGRWVTNRADLGEYTYNVQSRKLYKYKTKVTDTSSESKWFDKNPGGDWVYANQTKKVKVN